MEGFANRLNQIIDYYGIRVSDLADRMHIQRSTLSHLFAGRNKPGFEFLEKLVSVFPDLNLNWVVSGRGEMIVGQAVVTAAAPAVTEPPADLPAADLFSIPLQEREPAPVDKDILPVAEQPPVKGKKLRQVLLLYTDGSMEQYSPSAPERQ